MYLLAIETSCDETSAAVSCDNKVLSNVISSQWEHERYGGVVPELASRIHQQRIVGVVGSALEKAGVKKEQLDAVAFTQGPGLLGSLLVGVSFAKAFALALNIPLVAVNHLDAHILANFLSDAPPAFPFLCLTVSGGHTQLVLVRDFYEMEILGETMDDAAGEAFDKAAKMLNLPYPGGPLVDKHAKLGNPNFHAFPDANVGDLTFSFSGLKTSLLYFLKKNIAQDADFVQKNLNDICASYQHRIVSTLLDKMEKAAKQHNVKQLAIAGGVSANSELRRRFALLCEKNKWQAHIPAFEYCTDNAGMIAIAGYYKYLKQEFVGMNVAPFTRS